MKFSHFLLAAGLCSFSAASAQTTPAQQSTRGTGSTAPSAVPSGTAPMASDPKGNVGPGEVFTKGSPDGSKRMKTKRDKSPMSDGKMKAKM
ncbi:MAG: hypothetical protein EOO57_10950 [Hymenobacter sp.]|nr:MAG: hypothetical protein EOO57_10950 [Hymenobacter sp.]